MRSLVAASVLGLGLLVVGCQSKSSTDAQTLTKLESTDIKVGTGPSAELGDSLFVHYKGWLDDKAKTVIDENGPDKDPMNFVIGAGRVIKGWEKGVIGMKAGGKRHLHIPPSLAYGSQDNGKVPANSALNFDIEVVRIMKRGDAGEVTVRTIKKGKGAACKVGDNITVKFKVTTMSGSDIMNNPKDTATFELGKGQMLSDLFDDTIKGMKVGETREVTVPPGAGMPMPAPTQGPQVLVYKFTLLSINHK